LATGINSVPESAAEVEAFMDAVGVVSAVLLGSSSGGCVLLAGSFLGLLALPVSFSYPTFAGLLILSGIGQGMFAARTPPRS
jgi:hypothetical protein